MLSIRKATQDDVETYFRWANDQIVRQNAFTTDKITWETHVGWYSEKLKDHSCYLYIIEKQNNLLGQVRFDVDPIAGNAEISYSVGAEYRGGGLGKILLDMAIIQLKNDSHNTYSLIAKVKGNNTASSRVFINSGFEEVNNYHNDFFRVLTFEKKLK